MKGTPPLRKKVSKEAAKRNAPESASSSKGHKADEYENTPPLSKSFVKDLTKRVHLSDAKTQVLVDELLKSAE